MRLPMLSDASGLITWAADICRILESGLNDVDRTKQTRGDIYQLKPYAKADLPTASDYYNMRGAGFVLVTDETGGAVPAFSDGAAWRRVTDRAIVS